SMSLLICSLVIFSIYCPPWPCEPRASSLERRNIAPSGSLHFIPFSFSGPHMRSLSQANPSPGRALPQPRSPYWLTPAHLCLSRGGSEPAGVSCKQEISSPIGLPQFSTCRPAALTPA